MEFIETPNKKYIADYLYGRFGTHTLFPQEDFLSYAETKKFIISLGITCQKEWNGYRISGEKPDNIPSGPAKFYKEEWISWGDFLGTENIANQNRIFLSFKEARKFIRKLKLKNQKGWRGYCKLEERPDNIPANLERTYRNEWKGWKNFLGTDFLSFEETRKWARKIGIKSKKEWNEYSKSGKKPNNIPSSPYRTYKNKGWIDWYDFLGMKRKAA